MPQPPAAGPCIDGLHGAIVSTDLLGKFPDSRQPRLRTLSRRYSVSFYQHTAFLYFFHDSHRYHSRSLSSRIPPANSASGKLKRAFEGNVTERGGASH